MLVPRCAVCVACLVSLALVGALDLHLEHSISRTEFEAFLTKRTPQLKEDRTSLEAIFLMLNKGKLDRIELLNPCERVTDLLENLGVLDLMSVGQGANPFDDRLEAAGSTKTDKRALTEASLEAHKLLMEVNPDNVPKFKDVAQFLAEDLERQG